MKNFKSLIVIVTVMACLCTSVSALATAPITVDKQFDNAQSGLAVSGTIQSSRSNPTVTLEMKNPSGVTVYVDQTVASGGSYQFAPIKLHPGNTTGDYTILVTVEDLGEAEEVTYYFAGAEEQLAALKAVNLAAADSKCSVICANANDLGISEKQYNDLGNDGKETVKTYFSAKTYTVPENVDSEENIEILIKSINVFRKDYNDAICTAQFNDIKDSEGLAGWIDSYTDILSVDNPYTTLLNEEKMYEMVEDAFHEAGTLERVAAYTSAKTPEEAVEMMLQAAAMTIVETHHYTEIRALYDAFPELFGINTANLQRISKSQFGTLYERAKGKYSTFIEAGAAFNACVNEMLNGDDGGNGGGSSSGGKGAISAPPLTGDAVQDFTSDMPFPDMSAAVWANEAVTALKEMGVLCGDENGYFNPQNPVTRSEFIKMVVLAAKIDLESIAEPFDDVNREDWCYQYVITAKSRGLIMGDGDNCFRPNAFITRQDMAVILYRTYGIADSETFVSEFADSNEISGYAKNAVAYLSNRGIIKGVGGNLFVPLNNATRAEAAQMLYNGFVK